MATPDQELVPLLDKDGVRLTVDDALATVTLTNPAKRNAQSPAMWRALAEAGRQLPGSVRVVVLRGEGKSFSAGLDRQMFLPEGIEGEPSFIDLARSGDAELDAAIAEFQEGFTWWRRGDLVSIAAVQGHAIGAGFQLALACDLRVVADDVQFAMRETGLGLVPDLTGTHPLVSLVGYGRAVEICLTGRRVDAEEAHSIGLVNRVFPDEVFAGEVEAIAEGIAGTAPIASRYTTVALRGGGHRDLESAIQWEALAQPITLATEDLQEGVRAAQEKRSPRFRGV